LRPANPFAPNWLECYDSRSPTNVNPWRKRWHAIGPGDEDRIAGPYRYTEQPTAMAGCDECAGGAPAP